MDPVEEIKVVKRWIGAMIMSNAELIKLPAMLGTGTLHAQNELLLDLMQKLEDVENHLLGERVEAK